MMVMKTSLVCLLFVIYMGIFYFSNKHLPLKATRIFSYYYASAVIVTVFDLITLYTVNNLDSVSSMINYIAHIIYLLAINTTIFLYFLYLRSLLENQIRISGMLRIMQAAPFAVTSILVLALPITYVEGVYTNYSLGPKAYAIYASVILYNLLILYYCVRYWNLLNREKRSAIIASVPIFFVISVINIAIPEALFSIVYIILATVGLMMSNENSEKYLDKQTGMFNQYALGVVIGENIAMKRNILITVMTLSESENVRDAIDWKQYVTTMEQIQNFCRRELKSLTYRVGDNGFVFLTNSKHLAEKEALTIQNYLRNLSGSEMSLSYKAIALNECSSNDELMSKIVEICSNALNKMAIYDFLTGAYNRNSFEKELAQLRDECIDAYYFLADVNNLKATNDAMGHSAGDEMLQAVAKVLKETAGKDGMVFRYGGDEFAVLWNGTDAEEFMKSLEKNCKKLNRERVVPVSFAIGYGKILEEVGLEKADRMMYENKAKMKSSYTAD